MTILQYGYTIDLLTMAHMCKLSWANSNPGIGWMTSWMNIPIDIRKHTKTMTICLNFVY